MSCAKIVDIKLKKVKSFSISQNIGFIVYRPKTIKNVVGFFFLFIF